MSPTKTTTDYQMGLSQIPLPSRGEGPDPQFLSFYSEILHLQALFVIIFWFIEKNWGPNPLGGETDPLKILEKSSIFLCEVSYYM